MRIRKNNQIRSKELRVIDVEEGNLGILSLEEALKKAQERGLDLIEISPKAKPPVAKIMDFGKYQYEEAKKAKKAKQSGSATETKSVQVKIGTGDHDLQLKAKRASKWLKEGHRVKCELFLRGRSKYMNKDFLHSRLERFLHFITEEHKIAEPIKKSPRGIALVIERSK